MGDLDKLEKIEIIDDDNVSKEYTILACYHSDVTNKKYVICADLEDASGIRIYPFILTCENDDVLYNIITDEEDKKEILKFLEKITVTNNDTSNKEGD